MTDSSALAQIIQAVQNKFQEQDFVSALELVEANLRQYPNEAELLYLRAVARRYLKQFKAAAHDLDQLLVAAPDMGRAHQEYGHLMRDQGRWDDALARYRQAIDCNRGLIASWSMLAEIYRALGEKQALDYVEQQLKALQVLPPVILRATQLLHDGLLGQAETLCRTILQKDPQNIQAMRLLAEIASRLGVLNDTEFLLESAITFAPEDDDIRLDYLLALRRRQKFTEALAQAEYLVQKNPDNLTYQSQMAVEKMQMGEHAKAVEIFDKILALAPQDPNTLTSKGHALKTMGDQSGAVAAYEAACAAKPDHGDAYFSLSNLKTYRFDDDAITAMENQLQRPGLMRMNQIYFHFALAAALENKGAADASFHHLILGNDLKRQQSHYDAARMTDEMAAQIDACTASLFDGRRGCDAPDPIFIVGLPRSGSTLIEQILASHSQVDGTLELPNILSLAQSLRGQNRMTGQSAYPQNLHTLSEIELQALGQAYIDETRIHRGAAPFFTDKMPNNFRHIGLIHLILPNAKIIDARRAPLDCCFGGFKQLFAQGQEFSYGLHEIGSYYRDYVQLMAHWDDVLPGKVLRVQHEDVIVDLEGQVRRMLDYLCLPFEAACLNFHETDRAVRTASSEQVRQPINRAGMDRWRAYAAHLMPLIEALGENLVAPEDWAYIKEAAA